MYKKIWFDELTSLNTQFFQNLKTLYTKQKHIHFRQFLNEVSSSCARTYFFESSKPVFRIYHHASWTYRFIDEQEKIDVTVDEQGIQRLHNLFKDTQQMKILDKNLSILDQLLEQFTWDELTLIQEKPFIVYDIETTFQTGWWLASQYFEMAYSISSLDCKIWDNAYEYVDRKTMKSYCDKLLDFEWRIIGYNQIAFDNPVLIHNVGYSSRELEELNRKSIDPFLLLRKLTWRRLSLNAVASALVSTWKTLASWKEWADYLAKFKETWNPKLREKVQLYCKNDVKITLGVLLYLLSYRKVHFDWSSHTVDADIMIELWGWKWQEDQTGQTWWQF